MQLNISHEEMILIDRFLSNELDTDELNDFQHRLKTDAGLEKKLSEIRLLRLGIAEAGVREELQKIHQETFGHSSAVVKRYQLFFFRKYLSIAASVLLVVVLGVSFYLYNHKKNELYARYFKPDPGLMTMMSTQSQYEFQRAMVDYKEGKYRNAIIAWEEQSRTVPGNDTLAYFIGVAYQALGNQEKAQSFLLPIAGNPGSNFYREANWYVGLSLVKEKKYRESISYLKTSDFKQSEPLIAELKKK